MAISFDYSYERRASKFFLLYAMLWRETFVTFHISIPYCYKKFHICYNKHNHKKQGTL